MRSTKVLAVGCTALLAVGVAACGSDSNSSSDSSGSSSSSGSQKGGTINGAGATFPAPVYSEWAARFKDAQGTTVNYQAIGSGGGIAQFTAGTVDFGASDAPMKDEEIKAAAGKGVPVHVPTVAGAVTVSYKVNGVDKGLKLDGATIADIFLGKVKKWNDPAIASLNSGASLPGPRSRSATAPTSPAPRRTSRSSSATTRARGRAAPAPTSPSSGRPARAPRATTGWRAASSRPTAPWATSSRRTRCRTTSPTRR